MIRRRGASIHSVRTYDQRIQREYGDTWNHVEMTRTISAMRNTAKTQDTRSIPKRPGELNPHATWRKNLPRNSSKAISSRPPTTTTTSDHHGADAGCPPDRTIR